MNCGPDVSTAIDLLPEPILFVTVGGVVLGGNAALVTQLGISRLSLKGMDLLRIAVDSPASVLDYLGRCARSGQLLLGSLTLRGTAGRLLRYRAGGAALGPRDQTKDAERAVLLRLVPVLQSGLAFMALNEKIRELSAENARRRLIEEDLRKERETLQVTLSSIGDAVIVTDAQGAITFLNAIAESLVGRDLKSAREQFMTDVFRLINERTQTPVEDPVQRALRTGMLVERENHVAIVRPDGTTVPIDASAAPIRLEEKIIGAVLIFRDISARRQAELDARDADRRKDEFLATLAHELRNPLAPIRNGMQILASTRGEAEAKSADVRLIVERQLNHMVRLIDDLMDLSRITQGRLELHQEQVELGLVIKVAAETSMPLLNAKQHRLRIISAAEPVYVQADVTRLAQVFSNLLNNSAKYSPNGSDIAIVVKREGAEAIVEVIDAGAGIPPALIPRIFDMFVQLNPPGMREGLGIGLALVKRIMELHGGTVEALSEGEGEGKGSTFRIRLTAANSEVETTPVLDRESVQPSSGTRVLVVDDNRDAADTLTLMLELAGHEVRTAYDGIDALQMAETFRPRIMLLDIGMPLMDGYQTALRIRDRSWGRSMVLVALTGWGQEQDRRRTREAGFDHHFVKPVDPQAINRLIDQARFS
jgi:PAS domain S-box-containing protein